MTGWRDRILRACALMVVSALVAGPVAAQNQTPPDEVAVISAQLIDKLDVLRDALGINAPPLPAASMTAALTAAIPAMPEGDSRDWSTSVGFDFKTERVTGSGLEPDEDGYIVFADARACLVEDEVADIVHFERFSRGEIRGHRCILSQGGRDDSLDAWVLVSRTFAEGPDRRLTADYAIATAVEGDRDMSRRLLEARLEQNVAMAGLLADYALEMLVMEQASSDPLTMDNFTERLARLQQRLADVAASLEEAAPATD